MVMDVTDSGRVRVRRNRRRGEESHRAEDNTGPASQIRQQQVSIDWSLLWSLTGLLTRSVGFQMSLMYRLIKFPPWLIYRFLIFVLDPSGTMRRTRRYLMSLIVKICDLVLKKQKPVLEMVCRLALGFFWSVYVGIILCALLVLAFLISGFLMSQFVQEPFVIKESLNFDYTKISPEAYVPITFCECDAAIGVDSSYKKSVKVLKNPPNQWTEITLSMTLPESEYNRKLGMFQVRVDLLSASGRMLATSRRPCIVKFRSWPVRLLRSFLKIVTLVSGYFSEIQTVNLKLNGFNEEDVFRTACLKVMIEQRAEFLRISGAGIPEIYEASLLLESNLPFLKRIIWKWRRTLFVWISMSLLFALVCFGHPTIPRRQQRSRTPSVNNNSHLDGQAAPIR